MCRVKENIKSAMLAFGIIFVLTGVALISIGIIYELAFDDLTEVIPNSYSHLRLIPILTIVAGSLISALTLSGCFGALLDKQRLLIIHCILLILAFFFQLSVGIFTFLAVRDETDLSTNIHATIDGVFRNYNQSEDVITFLQDQLKCCGTNGSDFWNHTMNLPFPRSCCKNTKCDDVYGESCQDNLFIFLIKATRIVGGSMLVLSMFEVVGVLLAMYMARIIKKRRTKEKTESERAYGLLENEATM